MEIKFRLQKLDKNIFKIKEGKWEDCGFMWLVIVIPVIQWNYSMFIWTGGVILKYKRGYCMTENQTSLLYHFG